MTTIACVLFWALVPFIVLGVITDRLLETPTDRIHRWRADGCSWAECARRAGLTIYRGAEAGNGLKKPPATTPGGVFPPP